MGLERSKSDLEHVVRAAPRVEHRAAAALAVSVDRGVDRRIEPNLRQGRRNQPALPIAVARGRPMLERAAAANCEMRTDRRDPLAAADIDLDEMAAVGMTGPSIDLDGLARQGIGRVDRARRRVRDAVAAPAEPGNDKPLSHVARR